MIAENDDYEPNIAATIAAFFIALFLLFPRCGKSQEVFRFNTSTVIMADTSGRMDTGLASWPVLAHGDTLEIAIPTKPITWWGIHWIEMDGGDLYYNTATFSAHYSPGPGGKSLIVRPSGAVRVIELYEHATTRM